MKPLLQTVMEVMDCDKEDAEQAIHDAAREVLAGTPPDEVLSSYFGIEPDWELELLEYCGAV